MTFTRFVWLVAFVLCAVPAFAQEPPPVTPPPMIATAVDLSGFYLRLDQESGHLERVAVDLKAYEETEIVMLRDIQARLIKHDEEPAWIAKVLSNHIVQAGLALVGGLLADRFVIGK